MSELLRTGEHLESKYMTVHCAKCNAEWTVLMNLPKPIRDAVKIMKGAIEAGCPNCGANGHSVMAGSKLTPDQWAQWRLTNPTR